MNEIAEGKPKYFDINQLISFARSLEYSDEPLLAIKLLTDFMPSYYRENIPSEIIDVKNDILSRLANVIDYSNYKGECYPEAESKEIALNKQREAELGEKTKFDDLGDMINIPFCQPRGAVIKNIVHFYNNMNITPHIVEMGPAQFWLPHGLNKHGLKYSYDPLTVNKHALESQPMNLYSFIKSQDSVNIFVCFETIEHLYYEDDITIQFYNYEKRYSIKFDCILLSTPKNTFMGGDNRPDKTIEHLRSYSPSELLQFGLTRFKNFEWRIIPAQMMVIIGFRKEFDKKLEFNFG